MILQRDIRGATRRWSVTAIVYLALACMPTATLSAEEEAPRWITWMFQGENDVIAVSDPSDEHYTNGLRFYGLRNPETAPPWAIAFTNWWCRKACPEKPVPLPSVGFAIGQNFYTPDDLTVRELIPEDRPYAGWLYGAALLRITDEVRRRQHAFELQLGIVGPEAGAEWIQTELHELIDSQIPQGWDHQLPTEPAINLIYRYSRRVGGSHLDLVPHAGGALGTIRVSVSAGATVRAGWNISGFPQTLIPITDDPDEPLPRPPDWEFYLFAGAEGRAVAHNIFLDGTVFSASHSVDKEDFVYDLTGGFSLRYKRWRLQYTFVRRSEEFFPRRGGSDGIHNFGSLSIGWEWSL